jgi:hypothetical protein
MKLKAREPSSLGCGRSPAIPVFHPRVAPRTPQDGSFVVTPSSADRIGRLGITTR